jgi:hypothetical protein
MVFFWHFVSCAGPDPWLELSLDAQFHKCLNDEFDIFVTMDDGLAETVIALNWGKEYWLAVDSCNLPPHPSSPSSPPLSLVER